ncbi:esterase/lipase family protein [Corynebacterium pseudopelargi]|uniref:Extracellular esterase EstB n=1 Tax=Corynebacterium pseudopelargi TaxID=2080757 RepID=A0A3G6IXX4_9CORY|nr:alpha/beta fold hydrolase [Corynebacterium pseudopelargi]AZA08980.1 Extracellular esterase EstB precursor [Corynebacterium pseudopelargi]
MVTRRISLLAGAAISATLGAMSVLTPLQAQALPGAPVADAQVEAWTAMGPQLEPAKTLPGALAIAMGANNPSPKGANEACSLEGENPVVLIHGMTSNAYSSFGAISPVLKAQGRCVYAMNYGYYTPENTGSSATQVLPGFYGYDSLDRSLAQVSEQIEMVKRETGAQKVDLVGWSAGGSLAAAYAKQVGAAGVGTVVSIGGVLHGTTMGGLSNLVEKSQAAGVPADAFIAAIVGPAGNDLLKGSAFMQQMNEGGLEAPGVRYVAISTLYDESATPLEATQFNAGDFENLIIQDGCPSDKVDHLGTPYDDRAIAMVANALGGDVALSCRVEVGPAAGLSSQR